MAAQLIDHRVSQHGAKKKLALELAPMLIGLCARLAVSAQPWRYPFEFMGMAPKNVNRIMELVPLM